jgi:hypothetical protein
MLYVCERSACSNDLRVLSQLITEGVIAIAMRVEYRADFLSLGNRLAHAVKHFTRELQIQERVHQQCLVAVHN